MTLLEFLNTRDIFAAANGIALTEVHEGRAVAAMTVERRHLNGAGICQGGALFTLADLAAAGAMNSCGVITVGLENSITFHKAAVEGDILHAEATLSHDHARIPFCKVEIRNAGGELIVSGTSLGYRKKDSLDFESLM